MNLFSAQKTNPSKSRLAKIFAIFLVCFFVGVVANNVFAQGGAGAAGGSYTTTAPTPREKQYVDVKLPGEGQLAGAVELRETMGGWGPTIESTAQARVVTFKDPNENNGIYSNDVYKVVTVSDNGYLTTTQTRYTYKIDPTTGKGTLVPNFPKMPKDSTYLELDPTALPEDSVVKYDYEGGVYIYTDANGNSIELSPDNIREQLEQLRKEEGNPEQQRKIVNAIQRTNIKSSGEAQKNASNQAATGDATNNNRPDMECGWKDLECLIAKMIFTITIGPAGLLLSASGWLMSKTFEITVVDLAKTLGTNGTFYPVIKLVWGMFRDIINMTFIFLLLYASIMTILKADTSRIKSMVGKVVIVAILINFSLFFTTAIIDTSNVLAVGIYNQINQGGSPGNNNLAAAFLKQLKLETLLTDAKGFGGQKAYGKMITICIFGSVFILVLAVMFFVISVLFIIRFATLLMLMMMSPLGIGVIAIPKLEKAFDGGYWSNLLSQCFFAPIMILFLWISIKLLEGIVRMGGPNPPGIASSLTNPDIAKNYLGTFLLGFIVLIMILIKGIEFSKSMSAKGAGAIQSGILKYSGADWMQNKMKNAPRAVGGAAARNTAGRMATRFADSEWGRNMQTTALGRLVNKGARSVADAKFGGKNGFAKNEAESIKQREKLRETLDKKSFAEQEAIEAQKEKVRAESAKELEHTASASEANTVHSANQALAGHTKDKTDLEEKKRLAEALVKQQTDYLNDPATQANAAHKKAAEDSLKKAADELEKVESEIENLDEALIKAFKSANIEIDPKDLASIANAKTALDAKNADLALKAGLDASASSKDVAKAYNKLLEKQKESTQAERTGLKAIEDAIKEQSKTRQEQYARSLSSRGINNLFMPSRAAQQAAMNVRREANKTSDERDKDEMNRLMKKLLAEKEKEGGGDKGKEEKKDK